MLEASMTVAALGTFLTTSSSPALAEGFEDLAMPSEAEQQQQAEVRVQPKQRWTVLFHFFVYSLDFDSCK